MLRMDAIRSLFFVTVAFFLLWFYLKGKLKSHVLFISLAAAFLVDGWTINKRYLNDEAFVPKARAEVPFLPSPADEQIFSDTSHFRVMNTTVDVFNDASTSYFHKSIGGYHGAKLKRYQELIEKQISKGNMKMLDMLNMKYVIQEGKDKQPYVAPNPNTMGNAWFVNDYRYVANADSEIVAMTDLDPKTTAVVDQRFKEDLKGLSIVVDSTASIKLTSYAPDQLSYHYKCQTDQLAVFSEVYYPAGWNAYIDEKLVPHIRVDYVLRAMKVPAGEHELVFKFEPTVYANGERIALAASSIILLLGAIAIFLSFRKEVKTKEEIKTKA